MTIEEVVDVQITREASAVSQAGFGAANFLSNNAVFAESIKEYSTIDAVNEDDLVGADAKLFAAKYFGQEIRPEKLYITKKGRDLKEIQRLSFDGDFLAGSSIDLKINGVSMTTAGFNTDQATTIAALATALLAHGDVESATVIDNYTIDVQSDTVGLALVFTEIVLSGGSGTHPNASVTLQQSADEVLTDVESLERAQLSNNDWYGLAIYNRTSADIILIAAWIQPQKKLFVACSNDSDVLTSVTTDVASLLKAASYTRTVFLFSNDQANYPEGAWMGSELPKDPGSTTWMFKTLSGITVDTLTDTEKSNAKGKNANIYITRGGVNMTEEGKTSEGTYIDLVRGTDWIEARGEEAVFIVLVNEDKVPYTNNGVNSLVNAMAQVLQQAENQGILTDDPKFTITAGLVQNQSTNDRINRIFPDITFVAVFAGAIHKTTIKGTISV